MVGVEEVRGGGIVGCSGVIVGSGVVSEGQQRPLLPSLLGYRVLVVVGGLL